MSLQFLSAKLCLLFYNEAISSTFIKFSTVAWIQQKVGFNFRLSCRKGFMAYNRKSKSECFKLNTNSRYLFCTTVY